jgi:HKD family nuclease
MPEALLTTGGDAPLLAPLEQDLAHSKEVDIAVAFVLQSGVDRLYPHFIDLLQRGGILRLLTGDYLEITDPDALQRLLDLRELAGVDRCILRVFESGGTSFHPKAYLISQGDGRHAAYVGSSNLSQFALTEGVEWNFRVSSERDSVAWKHVDAAFEALFRHPSTVLLDQSWLRSYRTRRKAKDRGALPVEVPVEPPAAPPAPNAVQSEALAALEETRRVGNRSGLVVMATGLGKTWLAAFDTNRTEFRRVLFVAHREEILTQAMQTFRRIRPAAEIGVYAGGNYLADKELVFASIQTLSRREHLSLTFRTSADAFPANFCRRARAGSGSALGEQFGVDEPLGFDLPVSQ